MPFVCCTFFYLLLLLPFKTSSQEACLGRGSDVKQLVYRSTCMLCTSIFDSDVPLFSDPSVLFVRCYHATNHQLPSYVVIALSLCCVIKGPCCFVSRSVVM